VRKSELDYPEFVQFLPIIAKLTIEDQVSVESC